MASPAELRRQLRRRSVQRLRVPVLRHLRRLLQRVSRSVATATTIATSSTAAAVAKAASTIATVATATAAFAATTNLLLPFLPIHTDIDDVRRHQEHVRLRPVQRPRLRLRRVLQRDPPAAGATRSSATSVHSAGPPAIAAD